MLKAIEKAKALKEFKELRLKLGSELSALEKAKSLKRFRELRVLLGGEGSQQTLTEFFITAAHGEGNYVRDVRPEYGGGATATFGSITDGNNDVPDVAVYFSLSRGNLKVVVDNAANDILANLPANEANILKAFEAAKQFIRTYKLDPKTIIEQVNPFYQSVIDGAEITVDLIEQLKAEAEKDLTHPQLRPAVKIVVEKVKTLAATQEAA